MKLVTYDAGAGPRVGVLEFDGVVDAGWDGDMVGFIAAGAPVARGGRVEGARLLAPLRPRTLRDFLAFEGHLNNAYEHLGRDIPAEWYEVPAYYKGLPDTVIGPDEVVPWPAYSEELDHELELAAVIGDGVQGRRAARTPPASSSATRSGTTSPRATCSGARAPSAWAPARPRTGTAPTSSARAS